MPPTFLTRGDDDWTHEKSVNEKKCDVAVGGKCDQRKLLLLHCVTYV